MPTRPSAPHVLALLAGIAVLGLLSSLFGWPDPLRSIEFPALLLAAILVALPAVSPDRDWPLLRTSSVVELTSVMVFGTGAAMLVLACGLVTRELFDVRRPPLPERLARGAAAAGSLAAAGWTYGAVGGSLGPFHWPWQALPLAASVLVYCAAASASVDLVAPMIGRERAGAWRRWPVPLLRDCPPYLVGGSVAAALAEAIDQQAWEVLALSVAPLYLAHRVYGDHVSRLDEARRRGEALWQEVSVQRRALPALQRHGERLGLAAEVANDGLWEWDLRTGQLYVTGPWNAMLGLPPTAGTTRPEAWLDRVHPDDIALLKDALDSHLSGTSDRFQHEHRIRHEDGTYRFFQCRGVAWRAPGGRPTRIAGSLTDTTDLAVTQQRLRHAVYLDPLTGLYNRAVFVESLGQRLREFQRRRGGDAFALIYLDLDRFKVVNDSLGHLVGDELLVAVSRRLESCLRQGDVLGRLGGDEFAILLNGLQNDHQANVIASRVQDALKGPFAIGGREVFTTASIGIAFAATQYTSPDEMLHDADTAMYQAKANGKARHEVFDADMDARARDRLGLENDLRRAVNAGDFETHYQPIVSLATGMCIGFESLVRWTREGKPISPATFVPIAEELGLIERIGTQVLEDACRTFAEWQRAYPDAGLDCITVNVSSRQLTQHNFLRVVERAVRNAGLHPSALRIEITETALMTNPELAAKVLSHLRDFGVKIYLDDFGTGYSSLSHLHKLPVDALKIDRSFVRSLALSDRPAIVESILALARTLHTSVVAEGIETVVQARELERLGCTHAQGFLFSRPLSPTAAEELIHARQPLGPKRQGPSGVQEERLATLAERGCLPIPLVEQRLQPARVDG